MLQRSLFTSEHDLFREQVRRFFDREVTPHHARWEAEGIVPRSVWRAAGAAGLLCPAVPEIYGGGGGSRLHSAVLIEEVARAGASGIGFGLHSDIVAPYILAYGSEEQKRRWLPPMARGEVIGAIAMTEPGAGSDLQAVRTSALRDGDELVINGQKTFITNGQNADLVIVVAKIRLAEWKTQVQVMRVFVDRLMDELLRGQLDAATAAMAKYWTTDLHCRLLDDCLQMFGGFGYMWEYPIARAYADARVSRIYGGTNEIMKEIVSRTL